MQISGNIISRPVSRYEEDIMPELLRWRIEMMRDPSILNRLSKRIQDRINGWIPDKVHKAITTTIKQMIRAVLFAAEYTAAKPPAHFSLESREKAVLSLIAEASAEVIAKEAEVLCGTLCTFHPFD